MTHALSPRPSMSSTSTQHASADAAAATLFGRLFAIVGDQQMRAVYGEADPATVRAEWVAGMQGAGITPAELERGLAATRLRKFAPNLGEFLQLCRPVLDAEIAWHEAAEGMSAFDRGQPFAWSHPAVYWAARGMRQALLESTFQAARRRWEAAMLNEWAKGAWAAPPDPLRRLPGAGATQRDLETVPTMSHEVKRRLNATRARAVERMAANAVRMANAAPVNVTTDEPDMTEDEIARRKEAAALVALDAAIVGMRATGVGDSDAWRSSALLTLRDVSRLPEDRIRARLRSEWPQFFGRLAEALK